MPAYWPIIPYSSSHLPLHCCIICSRSYFSSWLSGFAFFSFFSFFLFFSAYFSSFPFFSSSFLLSSYSSSSLLPLFFFTSTNHPFYFLQTGTLTVNRDLYTKITSPVKWPRHCNRSTFCETLGVYLVSLLYWTWLLVLFYSRWCWVFACCPSVFFFILFGPSYTFAWSSYGPTRNFPTQWCPASFWVGQSAPSKTVLQPPSHRRAVSYHECHSRAR